MFQGEDTGMDAIITAGGDGSRGDPLYDLTGVEKKALIPLSGRPMIRWVAEALLNSGLVDNLVIVGLKPDDTGLKAESIHYIDAVGGMIDNILAALDKVKQVNPTAQKVLLCSSDIPLITPEIVRGFVVECGSQEADVYYAVVEEKTLEARFPVSKRTFIPFKGGRYSGGDLFLIDVRVPDKTDLALFRSLTGSRKNYWNQVRLLGFSFIIRFLLGLMTVHDAAKRGSQIFNFEARAVVTKFAELGMDLDKPHQYDMIKAELEKLQGHVSEIQTSRESNIL